MYKFSMPIGDWSDDGHGKCEYFIVKSNKPVEEVREIHFQIKEKTGVNIEELCSEYEDNTIFVDDLEEIEELGFDISNIETHDGKASLYPTDMLNLWVFLLCKTDETLKLEIEDTPEMLSFYGFDYKGRHIGFVGYGCF